MKFSCPVCNKPFAQQKDAFQHARDKHKKHPSKLLKPPVEPEESEAERVIDASLNRSIGIKNDPWIEDMYGDFL